MPLVTGRNLIFARDIRTAPTEHQRRHGTPPLSAHMNVLLCELLSRADVHEQSRRKASASGMAGMWGGKARGVPAAQCSWCLFFWSFFLGKQRKGQ